MACLRLFTFLPLRPIFSLPRLNSCISRSTFLPADGEYLRPEDFFDALLRLDVFLVEDFFEALLRALLFFALLFFALLFFALLFLVLLFFDVLLRALEDFFVPVDLFLAAFFVAMTILPRTQMFPRFETVVWRAGNPRRNCHHNDTRRDSMSFGACVSSWRLRYAVARCGS